MNHAIRRTPLPIPAVSLLGSALVLTLWLPPVAWANDQPPVRIAMPRTTAEAVAGKPYEGVFEVRYEKAAIFRNFEIFGEGWSDLQYDSPEARYYTSGGTFRIPFRGRPMDPNAPIGLRISVDRQKVSRSFEIGPTAFAKRGAIRTAEIRLAGRAADDPLRELLASATGNRPRRIDPYRVKSTELPPLKATAVDRPNEDAPVARGGSIPLRFTGRIVYDRIASGSVPAMTLGVDSVHVAVIDVDDISDETIWSTFTDVQGYFDSGVVNWDDCDITGCDDPDLMLRITLDSGIVDVTDTSLTEDTYTFETPEIEDFTGSEMNFGNVAAGDSSLMPAFHIYQHIVKTYRFIATNAFIQTPKTQILWPEPSTGNFTAYHNSGEIFVRPTGEWQDNTLSHEYGHHFLYHFGNPVSPDYCNGFCDGTDPCSGGTDCEDPGHCDGCPENENDAWNEGWPDWLAEAVVLDVSNAYNYDDGSPYQPLRTDDTELPEECCQGGDVLRDDRADEVESFVAALLRDIEDENYDRHNYTPYGYRDLTCLGVEPIFDAVVTWQPNTAKQFLDGFLISNLQHLSDLRHTAMNAGVNFEANSIFPPDTQPVGPVVALDSPTHPLGQGGFSYCVTTTWDPAIDDVLGACEYAFEWGEDPSVQPGSNAKLYDFLGCKLSAKKGFSTLGDKYLAIKARECETYSDSATAVFGPFEVKDCNGTGIADLCDIDCDHTGSEDCPVSAGDCIQAGCGTSSDCNTNYAPDECDIADGTSEDCNENGIPDECESMKNWAGGSGLWQLADGWVEKAVPVTFDHVCIRDDSMEATVAYSSGDTTVSTVASDESLTISDGADLTITSGSWIRDNLNLVHNGSSLQVNTRLDIDGTFTWAGGSSTSSARLTGFGVTHVHGALDNPSGSVYLADHEVVLEPGSYSTVAGRINSVGAGRLTIRPGATLEYLGTNSPLLGTGESLLTNQGILLKTGSSAADSRAPLLSTGLIHIQGGTFGLTTPSEISGSVLADPGTTFAIGCGGQEFLASSSIEAERVLFDGNNCGTRTIRGTYDVSLETVGDTTSAVVFAAEANIVSFGPNLLLNKGNTTINASVGGPILFDTLKAGGTVRFLGGDPISATNFEFPGSSLIEGNSSLTINGAFNWYPASQMRNMPQVNLNAPVTFVAGGAVRSISATTVNLASSATFLGGMYFYSSAVLNNLADGSIDLRIDGNVLYEASGDPRITNAGSFVKSAGAGVANVFPEFTNSGSLESQSGTINFRDFTQVAGQSILNGGNLSMLQVSPAYPFDLQGGSLTGTGTVNALVVNSGASVQPGFSAGTLTIDGEYQQSSSGRLSIELGGSAPGTEHDQLILTGNAIATLGGTLEVSLINGFVPSLGSTYDIVLSPNVVGVFDTIQTVGFPAGMSARVVDFADGIRIEIFNPSCDGIVSDFSACPDAICFSYTPGPEPSLATYRTAACPTGGAVPSGIDIVRGKMSTLAFGAGTVELGPVTAIQCAGSLDSFLWSGPPPAPGDGEFYLLRSVGGGTYGAASTGESRVAGSGDCP